MAKPLVHLAIIDAVMAVVPGAFIIVNDQGKITQIRMSSSLRPILKHCIQCNFERCLKMVFGIETASTIISAYSACLDTQSLTDVVRVKHCTSHGFAEYLEWEFAPINDGNGVVVFIKDVTESVLIEEEFISMSEQYESVNRERCVAMTNLDFHLMDLEQAHKKVAALYRITSIVQRTVNEREVLGEILDGITRELGFSNVAIMLLDDNTNELRVTAFRGQFDPSIKVRLGQGITGTVAQSRELIYVEDVSNDPRYIESRHKCMSEVAVPLIVQDRVVGVLNIEMDDGRTLQTYDLDLLRSLASQIAITIAHANHVAAVEMQAITDGLTGLYNYRYFRAMIDQEFKRALRYKRPLSLIMMDIDYFKNYNDRNGHRAGDEALRVISRIISNHCRDVDFAVRYGGEEFAIILPETKGEEAVILAERLRQSIADHCFNNEELQPNGNVTISIGVASYPNDACSVEELIDHADSSLYQAKICRNMVVIYNKKNHDNQS
ncbi:hypothetical protein SDC9_06098 [bioreactor metagenome]|uniref:GGDEF domain-containing protein n=1 Tax=bioreactor metagenome TaxID=1076179 RepID=A0A644T204_9ZZZZ|nr:sensor domain-containing diguanylate cyclase [Negativicutes bacterium]